MRETFSLNSKFALKHNEDGTVQLEGFAIHGGEDFIVNGFYEVPESEMRNCTKTLKGKKLLKDHKYEVDSIVGLVNKTRTTYDENAEMKGVKYSASLMADDSHLAEKIEQGLITDTSIGFDFTPICSICGNEFLSDKCTHHPLIDKDMHLVCKDMKCNELSLVVFGADPGASVSSSFGGEDAEKLKVEFGKIKDEIMSETKKDTLQTENVELKQQVAELEAKLEQLKCSHKSEIEEIKLENEKEIATLQQDNEALKAKAEEMGEELAQFRAVAEKEAEARLEEKREKLRELKVELKIEKNLADIDEMGEDSLDAQIATFEEILENRPAEKPPKFTEGEQKLSEKTDDKKVAYSALLKAFKG